MEVLEQDKKVKHQVRDTSIDQPPPQKEIQRIPREEEKRSAVLQLHRSVEVSRSRRPILSEDCEAPTLPTVLEVNTLVTGLADGGGVGGGQI